MDNTEKIIENPLFFKWVFNTNEETDQYWEDYLKRIPGEADFLNKLKNQFKNLSYKKEALSAHEKKMFSQKILERISNEQQKNIQKRKILSLLRYAAIAILFFSFGGSLVYVIMSKEKPEMYTRDLTFPIQVKEPTLIFRKGENVRLKKSESTLDYSQSGQIVLNEDSIIQHESSNDEPEINQLVIPYGNRSKVLLSDGSTVWLNAGSRLIYPSVFTGKNREVLLFGEAFFDIRKNENLPFIVKTSSLDIKVLGTKFNVSAYPDDNVIQTVLKEGSVAIRKLNANLFENDIVLKPDQLASFNKESGESKIYNVDAAYYSIWTEGLLSFDEVDLSRIIKKVERYYNIHVSYENPLSGTIKISGKLDLNQDRNEVFEYLSKVSLTTIIKIDNMHYRIK